MEKRRSDDARPGGASAASAPPLLAGVNLAVCVAYGGANLAIWVLVMGRLTLPVGLCLCGR